MEKRDGINWKAFAKVEKYNAETVAELTKILGYEPRAADFERMQIKADDIACVDGNILVDLGIQAITGLICNLGSQQPLVALRTFVGVGATATTATIADTHLGSDGGSAWYQVADSAPSRSTVSATNDTITTICTYGSGNANFAWAEWCWGTTTAAITPGATLSGVGTGAMMLNHKIASLGTKASGASWVFTSTITLS